jgi:hypothetical protein
MKSSRKKTNPVNWIKHNPELDKLSNVVLFPEKLDDAN